MYILRIKKGRSADAYAALSANKRNLERYGRKYPQLFETKVDVLDMDTEDNKKVANASEILIWHLVTMSESMCVTAETYMDENKIKYSLSNTQVKAPVKRAAPIEQGSGNVGKEDSWELKDAIEEAVLEESTGILHLYSPEKDKVVKIPLRRFYKVDDIESLKRIL